MKNEIFKIPILFLIFNRPKYTNVVFNAIKNLQPKNLYVAADGPRVNCQDDIFNCYVTRKISLNINWDCNLRTLFRDHNLGCGRAISEAITWFFNNVDYGIILEDDCVPCDSFFFFCKELLEKYQFNKRIMHINGNNFNLPLKNLSKKDRSYSYHFGSFAQVWGWASWKRAWENYDYTMRSWKDKKVRKKLRHKFPGIGSFLERSVSFDMVQNGKIDTWDYQWQYAVLVNNGLAIIPKYNLITNIGYGNDSTHIKAFNKNRNNLPTNNIEFPLKHSININIMKYLDHFYSRNMGMRLNLRHVHKYLLSYFRSVV